MAASTDGGHGAEAGSSGLPQLDFDTWPSQIFWLAVALVVLFELMNKVALPRIASVLEERADAVADDLDKADEFKRRAQEASDAFDKALADARAKAQEIAAETREEIQKEVKVAQAKADEEIAARTAESEKRIGEIRDSANAAIEEVALETSVSVLDRVLPGIKDKRALRAAVQSELS